MVADMNIIGTNQSQTATTDNPKQKGNNKTDSTEFADALNKTTKSVELKNSEKDGNNKNIKDDDKIKSNSKESKNLKDNNSDNTKESSANPVTTKVNSKATESQLVKALKNKESDIENNISIKNENEEKATANNKKDSNNKSIDDKNNIDSVKIDKKDKIEKIKDNNKADSNSNTDTNSTSLSLGDTEIQSNDNDINDNKESLNSKNSLSNVTKNSKNETLKELDGIKTLNDVKKEAQARNLNLQKMEILENGKKNKIDPKDLMDMNTLENNKERLSYSLQDKGNAVATSLAKINSSDLNEMSKKDALLAELLNRYDASANAKRKAQNEIEKLQFKINDGDKSIIVERTSIQPKNIVDSKFRNEIMEQEFLEQLYDITGDGDLGELIEVNKTKIKTHLMLQNDKANSMQDVIQKTYQGWAKQGQFLDPKELKNPNNTMFEMDVQKPFDALFSENLKLDKNTKEADIVLKSEKKTEDKQSEKIDSKQDVGSVHTKQEVSIKNAMAREAMKNFASQFRDEVLNYKPPVTKINLELNPANLGQVAMTISKKGKDLQVSITSNANVMTMFVQNAQELRQNLMQIGFNNLDLNFGTHEGQSSNQQQNNNEEQKGSNIKLQSLEEAEAQVQLGNIPQSIEISLPQYA